MRWIDGKPIQVGPLLVKRIPSSTAAFAAYHNQYWYGYLCPSLLPSQWIGKFGKLIEIRSIAELKSEREAYRESMKPETRGRLAHYEVINADA